MASRSLYRRILGARFEALPAVLRQFHDADGGGRARGTFRVERGAGRLRNAGASLLGLPRAGSEVAVRLHVGAISRQFLQHVGRHAPQSARWRL